MSDVEGLMETADNLGDLVAIAANYKAQLEAAGFSSAVAEQVAGSYLIDVQRAGIQLQAQGRVQ